MKINLSELGSEYKQYEGFYAGYVSLKRLATGNVGLVVGASPSDECAFRFDADALHSLGEMLMDLAEQMRDEKPMVTYARLYKDGFVSPSGDRDYVADMWPPNDETLGIMKIIIDGTSVTTEMEYD